SPRPKPPYRVIFLGEKSSLHDELAPVAQHVQAELLLPTGEISDTLIYDLARRAARYGRPAVVFYFSDFDPSGWQMSITVARKLQALKTLLFPSSEIEVHRVALTLEQAIHNRLPSTPLKATEKRGNAWKERWGREQTEIDALIALHPGTVRRLAEEAVKPYFDETL